MSSGSAIAEQRIGIFAAADSFTRFEGYGAGVTGGGGGDYFTAADPEEFSEVLNSVAGNGGNATIKLIGSWVYDESNVMLRNLSNVTIDGLDAMVTIHGMVVVKCSDNVILQGLRIRGALDDGIQINSSTNVVIDHCSVSGAGDGNIDITGAACEESRNVTVSWNIFADTWKQSLVRYKGTTGVTFHHNIFYNSGLRLPSLHEGIFDFRNNLLWQWGNSGTALKDGARANIVANYYTVGANGNKPYASIWYVDDTSAAWIEGNALPPEEVDVSRLSNPIDTPPVVTQSAEEARALVLQHAGAWPRDGYDAEIIVNVQTNNFPILPPLVP